MAVQISEALTEAHRRGIIHRDLKPANVLITEHGSAKLLDFGLAKLKGPAAAYTTTTMNALAGTPGYMSPEQASGSPVDERSDIFSFGTLLYEMASGKPAFAGASAAEVLSALLRDDPEPLHAPGALVEIIRRCLRKRPEERFQTAAEVRTALESISAKRAEDQPTIAVLPFVNLTRDPDDEYFSDGLAEEILNALSHISGLWVTARTSSFAFRGKEQDIRAIAGALGVRTILEGSVRRAANRIRVTAQLVNAADGYRLWSERYDAERGDVFALQDEIAAAIAGALQERLMSKATRARVHQPNLPAYEAYLKGRYYFARRSPEGFARAYEYLEEAIARDAMWPEPHSALGIVYYSLGALGLRPLGEMVNLARVEARSALELAPSDSSAHALLGTITALHDYDWQEAAEHFRLAMASEAVSPEIRGAYARSYLTPLGRFEEAIEERAKAIAQDPLNVASRTAQAGTFFSAGMYDKALAEARTVLEIDDRYYSAHLVIAETRFFQGRLTEARASAEEALELAPWDPLATGFLAGLLVLAGERDRAENLLASARGMVPEGMIMYHLVCSEIDAAVDWYERDVALRHPGAAMLAQAGFLKPLRDSPRWQRLARMMNLPANGL